MTKIATTTTSSTGYYEFNNLSAGSYTLAEELPGGWQQFKYPTTTIAIFSGMQFNTTTKSDFVNYYQGALTYCGDGIKQQPNSAGTGGPTNNGIEDCDGMNGVTTGYVCSATCVLETEGGSGGDDGSGSGGSGGPEADVCGDGILNNSTEQCDGIFGVSDGYFCTNQCQLQKIETNAPAETGPSADSGSLSGGYETGTTTGITAGEQTNNSEGGGLAINVPANENLAEENALPEEELLGEVEGTQTLAVCPDCATIDWVLVLLFLILTILIYRQINIIFPEYLAEKNRGQLIKIILWSALLLAAALGAWLILYACHFKLIWPAVLIIGFYVLLLALNFGQKKKGLLAGIFGLVLAVMVAFTYYFCARLGWQSWLMIVALYLATLISYFIGLLAGKFWLVSPALALLITFLLVVLNRCAC